MFSNVSPKPKIFFEKSKSKPFVATDDTKAYFIQGHGGEGNGYFEVPDNCMVVVKTQTGKVTYTNYGATPVLCELSPDILKNPLKHLDEIHEEFGSLAIYTPGQQCPNFEYNLMNCFPSKYPYTACISADSGLVDVDLIPSNSSRYDLCKQWDGKNESEKFKKIEDSLDKNLIRDYIVNLFKYSVYPTPNIILNLVESLFMEGETRLTTILEIISKDPPLNTTQEKLCNTPELRSTPSIYYNFVCRANESTYTLFNNKKNHNNYRTRHVLHKNFKTLSEEKNKLLQYQELHVKRNIEYNKYLELVRLQEWQQYQQMISPNHFNVNKLNKIRNDIPAQVQIINDIDAQIQSLHNALSRKHINTIKSHIGEAEGHRKPLMRNTFTPEYVSKRRQEEYNRLDSMIRFTEATIDSYKDKNGSELNYYTIDRQNAEKRLKNYKEQKLRLQKVNHPELFLKNGLVLKGGHTRKSKRSIKTRRTYRR